ncbi:Bifunctional enzyme IspD/IspF [Candidatus Hepatincola sp. Pdp]
MKNNTIAVILLASGLSSRTESTIPKQFFKLSNITLFEECLQTFYNNPHINYILPVINKQHLNTIQPIIANYSNQPHSPQVLPYCEGGNSRNQSVLFALLALAELDPTKVLIHDVSRPFISNSIINEVINNITNNIGVLPALKITDSCKEVENNFIVKDVAREKLYSVQTPQGFMFQEILSTYTNSKNTYNDDSSYFLENKKNKVKIVKGDMKNSKITFPEDLEYLKKIVTNQETRVGQGIDIHEFAENTPLYLGGVKIPYSKGLKGHSDADVVLHAIVDSLLGTVGLGDIGDYFPPSDLKWKNASSHIFVAKAQELIRAQHGTIINLDITIVAEEPKISSYKLAMKENIAKLLELSPERINIKATTAEKLGFVGRGEGIYACSIATVQFISKKQ